MKGKILVTGGTGYIGSHSTVELQNAGYAAEGGAGKDSRDFSGVRKRGRGKLCDSRRDFQHAAEQIGRASCRERV